MLHDSGKYEKQTAKIIPFCRYIDVYDNVVSAGTENFLVDGPKETIQLTKDIIPESASFGVKICGDSMEPEFEDGQIAWVLKQDILENGEIGIFYLNGDAYIKKLQEDKDGVFLISLNEKYPPIPVNEIFSGSCHPTLFSFRLFSGGFRLLFIFCYLSWIQPLNL